MTPRNVPQPVAEKATDLEQEITEITEFFL
jgi:hypothetical protein